MEDRLAEIRPDQPQLEPSQELADSVYALGLDKRLPLQALPYVLAHPEASVDDILCAKPLDHRRAAHWLGKAIVTQEAVETLADYLEGRAAASALLRLLVEIHDDDAPPPPPRIEQLMRGQQPEEEVPDVLREVFSSDAPQGPPAVKPARLTPLREAARAVEAEATPTAGVVRAELPTIRVYTDIEPGTPYIEIHERKQQMVDQYVETMDGIRSVITRTAGESEHQYRARLAKESLDGLLVVLGQSGEASRSLFTAGVQRFARQVISRSGGDLEGAISNFDTATSFIRDALGSYIDVTASSRPGRGGPEGLTGRIDRFLLTILGTDIARVALQFGISNSAISMANQKIKSVVKQELRDRPELGWHPWDNRYITTENMPGKEQYRHGLNERYRTSEVTNLAVLFDKVIGAPITTGEAVYYAGDPNELYLKRLADFSEVVLENDVDRLFTYLSNISRLVGYSNLEQLVDTDRDKATTVLAAHLQADSELALTVTAELLKAEGGDDLQKTLHTIREFWLLIHDVRVEEIDDDRGDAADSLYRQMAQYLPDIAGLTLTQACYKLRSQSRELINARYGLVSAFDEGPDAIVPVALLVPTRNRKVGLDRQLTGPGVRTPSEKVMQIATAYAQGIAGNEIAERFGFAGRGYITECVRRVIHYLEASPDRDPEMLIALQERYEANTGRAAKIRSDAQVLAPVARPIAERRADSSWEGVKEASVPKPRSRDSMERASDSMARRKIGRTALLNAEEEVILAKRIEAGVLAQEQLDIAAAAGQELDAMYSRELQWVAQDGQAAKQHMIEANLRLAAKYARSRLGYGLPYDDIVQEANLALMRAVEMFDFTKGNKFSIYAMIWIREYVSRAFDNQARLVRLPVHTEEFIRSVRRTRAELEKELMREPTDDEIAAELETSVSKIRESRANSRAPIQLDAPLPNGDSVLDVIDDRYSSFSNASKTKHHAHAKVMDLLAGVLEEREVAVISSYFGLIDGKPVTAYGKLAKLHGLSSDVARITISHILAKLRESGVAAEMSEILA